MVEHDDEFLANKKCPHDCPFRDKLDFGIKFCSYSIYSVKLDRDRRTRTEVFQDGTVDYHIPPNCDIYLKYKDKADYIKQIKTDYDKYYLERHVKEGKNSY